MEHINELSTLWFGRRATSRHRNERSNTQSLFVFFFLSPNVCYTFWVKSNTNESSNRQCLSAYDPSMLCSFISNSVSIYMILYFWLCLCMTSVSSLLYYIPWDWVHIPEVLHGIRSYTRWKKCCKLHVHDWPTWRNPIYWLACLPSNKYN